jgi:hypothetical protein
MPNPRRVRVFVEAQASWLELEAAVRQLVVATLRNDAATAEAVRRQAHAVLDHHLDLKVEGITAIRLDIERGFRG